MTVFLTETSASTVDARDFLQTAHGLVQNRGTDYRFYLSNQPAGFPPPPDVNLPLGGWGKARFQVTEAYQTIWYEVVIEREVSTGRNRRRCST